MSGRNEEKVCLFVYVYLCACICACIFVYVYLCTCIYAFKCAANEIRWREENVKGMWEGRVPDNQKSQKRSKLIELNKNDEKYDKSKWNQHMIIKQTFCLLNSV